MDCNNVKQLIGKYWDGNTNIEEEHEIKMFFSTCADLPEELEKWRSWFSNLSDISNANLGDDFDAKILERIEKEKEQEKVNKIFFPHLRNIAAACIVLSIIGISTWKIISYRSEKQDLEAMIQAKEDYEQIKNALYFTSSKINESEKAIQENLNKIEIINEIINIK